MRKWYSGLLMILLPLILCFLSIKTRRYPNRLQRVAHWLGYSKSRAYAGGIWIHAASVGEVRAALPLLQALRLAMPEIPMTLTTQTATGFATAQSLLGKSTIVEYCPLDVSFAVKRFLRRARPQMAIILETEIWPNCLFHLERQKIPVILANARLSMRSLQAYQRFAALFKPALNSFTHVFAQTEQDALNFLRVGVERSNLSISGNLKYDAIPDPTLRKEGLSLREKIGTQRPVWIAASTHEFEEAPILAVFHTLKQTLPDLLLIFAPRHPERFDPLLKQLQALPYQISRLSNGSDPLATTDILLCDVLGKLAMLYHSSDVAFIGGSFNQGQGHNPLEAATAECAIVTGHHVSSFAEICANLSKAQGLIHIADISGLTATTLELLQNTAKRTSMTLAAQHCIMRHQGAVEKHLTTILPYVCSVRIRARSAR